MSVYFERNGAELRVNSWVKLNQRLPAITELSTGGFVVTWTTDYFRDDDGDDAIVAQIFDAAGVKQGAEFLVNSETEDSQDFPAITALSTGDFVVTWSTWYSWSVWDSTQDSDAPAIKAQIFDAAGVKKGAEFLVNSETEGSQLYSTITALSTGGFVVTWTEVATWYTNDETHGDGDGNAIKAQIFDAAGVKQGAEFLVNSEAEDDQFEPIITGLSTGGFVIAWNTRDSTQDGDGKAIKAQIFDAAGGKQGAEFLVNSETEDDQLEPAITGLSTGGFVIAWRTEDDTQDGHMHAIKAQIFDAAGVKQGAEFLVNSEAAFRQTQPAITELSTGDFVVTWHTGDSAQDGDSSAIKAQVFDAAGGKQGSEFLVNSETKEGQDQPTITGLSTGGFVVAWRAANFRENYEGEVTTGEDIKVQVFTEGVNEAPVANDGTATVAEDGSLTASIAGDVADPEDGTLSYALTTDVSQGTLTFNPDGTYTYVPTPDYTGVDGFSYQVSDAFGASDTATVQITVTNVNDTPGGSVTITGTATEDETLTASHDLADGDGLGAVTYQWQRDGSDITGATGGTYTLTQADVGAAITVVAAYTDGQGTEESVTSSASETIRYGDKSYTGGPGDDVLRGRTGQDTLIGGDGNDTLIGGGNDDRLFGGRGDDRLFGGGGDDRLFAGNGDDRLFAGNGDDRLQGGRGDDRLFGGNGNDLLTAGLGVDILRGMAGDDTLYGQGGDDHLRGQGGNDTLVGGQGDDLLTGGAGADVFMLRANSGADIITDFGRGRDMIEIASGAGGMNGLEFTQVGEDVVVHFASAELTVLGTTIDVLQDADKFLFT